MRSRLRALRAALVSTACAAFVGAGAVAAPAQAAPDHHLYTGDTGQPIVAAGWFGPVLPTSGAVTQGPVVDVGFTWRIEVAGTDRDGGTHYHISTHAFRYDDAGNETMTKVCLAVRGFDTRPGAAVVYRPCTEYFTGSDQNWQAVQRPNGEWTFRNSRSGLVAGVRGGSTATGAFLELQHDTGATYQSFVRSTFTG